MKRHTKDFYTSMIELSTNHPTSLQVFYFNTKEDCEAFMGVFKDHGCNIEWAPMVQVNADYVPLDALEEAMKDPKKRAEDNLEWGFTMVERQVMRALRHGESITPEQKDTVNRMIENARQNLKRFVRDDLGVDLQPHRLDESEINIEIQKKAERVLEEGEE